MKRVSFLQGLLGVFSVCAAAFVLVVGGCGAAPLKDGVYEGKSGLDDKGAWGEVELTIKDGKPAACVFITREKDGKLKAEDYGKINGQISNADFYEKAQLAVRAMKRYAEQFVETGSLEKVDVISGATVSHNQFLEAAEKALERGRE